MTPRVDCRDCPWAFQDDDLETVSERGERHARKERHDVNYQRAVTDGGQDALTPERSEEDLFTDAIEVWGIDAQVEQTEEELAELLVALKSGDPDAVREELADVSIMVDQLSLFFGESAVARWREEKLARLEDRLEAADSDLVTDGGEDEVTIDREHAETLLEAAGTLRDDIASGRTWGWDEHESRENADDLDDAYRALQDTLRPTPATDGGRDLGRSWYVIAEWQTDRARVISGPHTDHETAERLASMEPGENVVMNGVMLVHNVQDNDYDVEWVRDTEPPGALVATDGGRDLEDEEFYVVDEDRGAVVDGPLPEDDAKTEARNRGPQCIVATETVIQMIDLTSQTTIRWEVDDVDVVTDGSGHQCDACGDTFETLTRLRLHEKDDCQARATYAHLDPDADDTAGRAAEGLVTCRDCGQTHPGVDYEETTSLAGDDYHLIVEWTCPGCGFENENRVVLEDVDPETISDLPPHLRPDDQELATDGGSKYVNETGPGYLGAHEIRTRGCGTNIRDAGFERGDQLDAVDVTDRIVRLLPHEPRREDAIDTYEVRDDGYLEFGATARKHLDVEYGDAIRLYDADGAVDVVPADDDPRLEAGNDYTPPSVDEQGFEVEQTALDGGQPQGQSTLDGGIYRAGGDHDA